jgi:exopolysaccharide production protein ExoZ
MEWLKQQFELSRGGGSDNVRSMEGLRGFAVFLVFLVHYVTLINPWLPKQSDISSFAGALSMIGSTGVDLFFVLSGYLIYGSLICRPQPFRRFMARRVERIYPAFTAVFMAYVVLSFVLPTESKIPNSLTAGLIYLLQNFVLLPGLFPIEPMNSVAWSLSYEMFYYLAIPLVITVFNLRRHAPMWRITFFAAIAVAIAFYCAAYGGPVRLIMFVSGILLYEVIKSHFMKAPGGFLGLLSLIGGLLVKLLPIQGSAGLALKVSVLFISFFVLCFSCFCQPNAWLAKAFSWAPMRWLGNMSYSYYLVHGLALKACFLVLGTFLAVGDHSPFLFWALLPVMFTLTLVPSAILFLAIEHPFSLTPTSRRANVLVVTHAPAPKHGQGGRAASDASAYRER